MRLHWEIPNDLVANGAERRRQGVLSGVPETPGPKECQSSKGFLERMNLDITNQVKKKACVETCSSPSSRAEYYTLEEF